MSSPFTTRRSFMGRTALGALAAAALERSARADKAARLLDAKTRKSIARGLSFLASRQNDDGSFGRIGYSRNVAVCSLAAMSFMSSGSMPGRGRYGLQVNRCVDYIVEHTQPSGFITAPGFASHGPMYGHGFATLFLAEVYGMTPKREVRERLSKAVKLIVETQNDEGGWRYHPQKRDADLSVTICQVMALRAAKNAGIFVPNETIDRCTEFVKKSQNADGGFMYMLSQPGDSRFPRSAAGVVALYSAGVYEGEEITKGLTYLRRHAPKKGWSRSAHFFYGQYYGIQAMWHAGGDDFRDWYTAARDLIVQRQQEDGSWTDEISTEYATSMSCIILQMPNNYLPIFQR